MSNKRYFPTNLKIGQKGKRKRKEKIGPEDNCPFSRQILSLMES
jgi:hypothetical protein